MSEGGITVYARKMQARFKEGMEAVRDSMRQRHHECNDRSAFLIWYVAILTIYCYAIVLIILQGHN